MSRTDYTFLLNESQSNDPITARFPRTAREAFGPYADEPLRRDIHFTYVAPRGWTVFVGVLIVAIVLGALK